MECFNGCNLEGYIPDNLFKLNCTNPTITKFLANNLVLPKLYKQNLYSEGKGSNLLFDIYYYIPSNFI
jgi:hypothetical protein